MVEKNKSQAEITRDKRRAEIVDYLHQMASFRKRLKEGSIGVSDILLDLSAFSARASLFREETSVTDNHHMTRFRFDEIDPFLAECDRQFKIYSRLQSVSQFELDLTKG